MPKQAARLLAPVSLVLCCPGAQAALSQIASPAGEPVFDADPSQLCRAAIAAAEHNTRIPDAFLSAIGRIESGRPNGGTLSPWPWTVNAAGQGHFYATKQAAMDAVRQFQAAGLRSIDVGCLQVNLFYHPDAFTGLEQAFDPAANAAFAANLLLELFAMTGSWPRAAAAYHSMTPALGLAYQQKVLEQWALPDRPAGGEPRRSARLRLKSNGKPVVVAEEPPAAPSLPAPPVAAAPPAFGFQRRFMLPAPQLAAGRSLAAYRTMPVQLAWRQGRIAVGLSR